MLICNGINKINMKFSIELYVGNAVFVRIFHMKSKHVFVEELGINNTSCQFYVECLKISRLRGFLT